MLRPAAGARRANDTLAVLVHAALLALFVQTLPDFKEPWQWMLLTIEAVSLAFHLWLAAIWFTAPEEWLVGRTNWYKWVEYAITATLGTLATGFASPDAGRSTDSVAVVVMLLVFLGVTQQASGAAIDFPSWQRHRWVGIVYAFAAQAGEFITVAYLRSWNVASGAYWTYVLMWTSFGVLCVLRSIAVDAYDRAGTAAAPAGAPAAGLFHGGANARFRETVRRSQFFVSLGAVESPGALADATDLSEACYSALGWISKFAVAMAIYFEEFVVAEAGSDAADLALTPAVALAAVVAAAALWQEWVLWGLLVPDGGATAVAAALLPPYPGEWRHGVAAVVHASSAVVLLAIALTGGRTAADYAGVFWVSGSAAWEPRAWQYVCPNKAQTCPDDDRAFYVTKPRGAVDLPILALATLYVVWSALNHTIAAARPEWTVPLRWADYSVTAPVMLAVIGLIFGCDKVTPIVLSPLLLMVLLVVAWVIEPVDPAATAASPGRKPAAAGVLALILALYVLAWAPVVYGIGRIVADRPAPDNATGASAPIEVIVPFASVMIVIFSSFAAVYIYDWGWVDPRRENKYIALSMVAKTTLHLFIGLTVVAQVGTLATDAAEAEAGADMSTLQQGLGGAAAIVLAGGALHTWGFRPVDQPDAGQYGLRAHLM